MFKKLWDLLEGKKSYIIQGTQIGLGVWMSLHEQGLVPAVPGAIIAILGVLGVGARALTSKPGVLVK